jgi:hypothetical protein
MASIYSEGQENENDAIILGHPVLFFLTPLRKTLRRCFSNVLTPSIVHHKGPADLSLDHCNIAGSKPYQSQFVSDAYILRQKPFQKEDQVEKNWNLQTANSPDEDLKNTRAMLNEPFCYSEKQYLFCSGHLPIQ